MASCFSYENEDCLVSLTGNSSHTSFFLQQGGWTRWSLSSFPTQAILWFLWFVSLQEMSLCGIRCFKNPTTSDRSEGAEVGRQHRVPVVHICSEEKLRWKSEQGGFGCWGWLGRCTAPWAPELPGRVTQAPLLAPAFHSHSIYSHRKSGAECKRPNFCAVKICFYYYSNSSSTWH